MEMTKHVDLGVVDYDPPRKLITRRKYPQKQPIAVGSVVKWTKVVDMWNPDLQQYTGRNHELTFTGIVEGFRNTLVWGKPQYCAVVRGLGVSSTLNSGVTRLITDRGLVAIKKLRAVKI